MSINLDLSHAFYDVVDLALHGRLLKALEEGSSRYPIYRSVRVAATADLQSLFDDFALKLGWHANRPHNELLMLDGPDLFVSIKGSTNKKYSSCFIEMWAAGVESTAAAQQAIFGVSGDRLITSPMFTLRWQSLDSHGSLSNVSIQELANETLLDQAYPEIQEGVQSFVSNYLDSEEAVLILYGPPGTGKTRLIRAILGEMSRRKGDNARVLYTADKATMESDQIFVKFITGSNEAFVIEDADHLLRSRSDGNDGLFRFLTIADGVARAQGRKIIFSTNLPHVHDMDDALVRPGRCFARLHVRHLTPEEAHRVIELLCEHQSKHVTEAVALLDGRSSKSHSLAEVYKAVAGAPSAPGRTVLETTAP
jgi:energy-coupling factor transporter ATP-binding protein EcfA2